jgi:hypothetical protein
LAALTVDRVYKSVVDQESSPGEHYLNIDLFKIRGGMEGLKNGGFTEWRLVDILYSYLNAPLTYLRFDSLLSPSTRRRRRIRRRTRRPSSCSARRTVPLARAVIAVDPSVGGWPDFTSVHFSSAFLPFSRDHKPNPLPSNRS